jgi:hypothetical protein
VRRLIVVAAQGLVVKPSPARPAPAGLKMSGKGQGRVSFRLFDPRKRFDRPRRRTRGQRPEPRIHFFDFDPRIPLFRRPAPAAPAPAPEPDNTTVGAASLCRRLAAIKAALEDLASQARRYARWRARPFERRRAEAYLNPSSRRPAGISQEAHPRGRRDPERMPLAGPRCAPERHLLRAKANSNWNIGDGLSAGDSLLLFQKWTVACRSGAFDSS